MPSYYNEIDPHAAQWLRNLIKAGHIAAGDVDERSIEDVRPDDLRGYTQCHFFAGIGVWSSALRLAGWSDDRPVWTGSCPCQPFSAAGKGAGFDDERHLWPAWHHLIRECAPRTVFGEQVASKDGLNWLDLVHADMEAEGYAFGAVDLCSAGVGAPHIRQRLWFVADSSSERRNGKRLRIQPGQSRQDHAQAGRGGEVGELADANIIVGNQGCAIDGGRDHRGDAQQGAGLGGGGLPGIVGDADDEGLEGRRLSAQRARELFAGPAGVAGFWADADWIWCQDGKWRAVEPGAFPLAHGAPARVVRLRAYGNAINREAAKTFITASMETLEEA